MATNALSSLLANALFCLDEFHIDVLRVDAVASMLYLDYSREEGERVPSEHGGNENLAVVDFLQRMNTVVHAHGGMTMAEESTAWPMEYRRYKPPTTTKQPHTKSLNQAILINESAAMTWPQTL